MVRSTKNFAQHATAALLNLVVDDAVAFAQLQPDAPLLKIIAETHADDKSVHAYVDALLSVLHK